MSTETILVEREEGVVSVTLNRPERKNAANGKMLTELRTTFEEAVAIVRNVTPERLTERIRPQGHDASVLEGIYQVVQHLSGHAFQIMLLTKLYTSQDLGFFAHLRHPSSTQSGRP